MENTNDLIKKCPACGKNQTYKNIEQLNKGLKNNTLCRSCSGQKRRIDLTGKKFGRLAVLSYDGNCHWKCQCDCGKIKSVYRHWLTSNQTKSCGCWRKEISERGHKPFQSLYKRLVWNCQKTNVPITLTFEEFLEFTTIQNCHYCNDKITWHQRNRSRYNLDRKNNNQGYTKENCVVCCKECNYAKNNHFTHDEMMIIGKAIGEVKRNRLTLFLPK